MVKYWERFLLGGVLTPVGILVTIVAINALLTAEGQPDSGFIIPFNKIFLGIGISILLMGLVIFVEGLIKEHRNKNKDIS
ncbi:MAG: hypothetical protein ACTSQI_19980 [Candidatus Helarchaeota archaeon]